MWFHKEGVDGIFSAWRLTSNAVGLDSGVRGMRTVCNVFLAGWLVFAPESGESVFWVKMGVGAVCLVLTLAEGVKLAKWIQEVRTVFDNKRPK